MQTIVKLLPILLLIGCQTSTTEVKTGYVNTEILLEKMKVKMVYDQKLAELKQKKQPEINRISNELEGIFAELKNTKIQEEDDYTHGLKDKKSSLIWRREMLTQSIHDSTLVYKRKMREELNNKIISFGKENNYQYILKKEAMLYGDSLFDITPQVLEYINK